MDCVLRVPFPSLRLCQVARDALGVDPEPKRSGVQKNLEVEENVLVCRFKAQDPRFLRVSINSFLDLLALVVDTMDQFDDEKEEQQ